MSASRENMVNHEFPHEEENPHDLFCKDSCMRHGLSVLSCFHESNGLAKHSEQALEWSSSFL